MNRFQPELHITEGTFEGQISDKLSARPGDGYNGPRWTVRAPFSRKDAAIIEGAARSRSKITLVWKWSKGEAVIDEWSLRQGTYFSREIPIQEFQYIEVVFVGVGPLVAV